MLTLTAPWWYHTDTCTGNRVSAAPLLQKLYGLNNPSRGVGFAVTRYQFCLACMEQLPVQLREKVLQFQTKAAAERIPISLLYIVSAGYDSVVTSMAGLPQAHIEPISPASFRQAAQVTPQIWVFTGSAGSGKTHAMQAQLQTAVSAGQQTVQLSLNENASAASLISSLSGLELSNDATAVIAIYTSSFASTRVVNQLLFQLLVEGVVTDSDTGHVFALHQNTATVFLVEVAAPLSACSHNPPLNRASASANKLTGSHGNLQSLPVLADCASEVQYIKSRYASLAILLSTQTICNLLSPI